MNKRTKTIRTLLPLFALLFLGIVGGKLFLFVRQAQLNSELVVEIKTRNDVVDVVSLLQAGADPNARDLSADRRSVWTKLWDRVLGRPSSAAPLPTALQMVLSGSRSHPWREEDVNVVRVLLERGADPNVKNRYGATPLMFAARTGAVAAADLLLQSGAHINTQDSTGETALYAAVEGNDLAMARLLQSRGARTDIRNQIGDMPLHEAVSYGHIEMALLLLEKGSDIEAPTAFGYSPLALAVCGNEIETAQMLLAHGARIEAVDSKGETPLRLAQKFGYTPMVRVLKRAGATK